MLNSFEIEKLKSQWGDKAESMDCKAWVRIYDPHSHWECYIYAINPEDNDVMKCIVKGFTVQVCTWQLSYLPYLFSSDGEGVKTDREYRPKLVSQIYKELIEREYERYTD